MINEPALFLNKDIATIEQKMLQMPQASCPVKHKFGNGVYIREVYMPAGTLAIGHHQNFNHWNVMLKGRVMMLNDDKTVTELVAPLSFEAKPGRKIGYVLEDMVWQNIYPTSETEVETLEATYLTKSDSWKENAALQHSLLKLEKEPDRLDFNQMLEDLGVSAEIVQEQSSNPDDQVTLDLTNLKVCLGDSPIHGKGLFATAGLEAGEVIAVARQEGLRTQAGRYTNHSRTPNAKMQQLADGNVILVALRDILGCQGGQPGEEITVDYRQAALEGTKQLEVICQQ